MAMKKAEVRIDEEVKEDIQKKADESGVTYAEKFREILYAGNTQFDSEEK